MALSKYQSLIDNMFRNRKSYRKIKSLKVSDIKYFRKGNGIYDVSTIEYSEQLNGYVATNVWDKRDWCRFGVEAWVDTDVNLKGV